MLKEGAVDVNAAQEAESGLLQSMFAAVGHPAEDEGLASALDVENPHSTVSMIGSL